VTSRKEETWVEPDCAEHVHGYQATKPSRDEQRRLLSDRLLHFLVPSQRAKKEVSDSPGLVDFAIGVVNFVVNLPDG